MCLIAGVTRSIRKFDNTVKEEITAGDTVGESKQTSDNKSNVTEKFEKYQDKVAKVKKLLVGKPMRFMREVTTAEEPMAVLCHGDFCRNNILFQYDVS